MGISRIVLLVALPISIFGQNRYFVSFKDKANTHYSTSNPLQFLSQKSIDRRNREHFQVTTEDLPVDSVYVNKVRKTGAAVFFSSRWFNGVLIQTDPATVSAVSGLSFVSSVELVAPGSKLTGARQGAVMGSTQSQSQVQIRNSGQLQMIGLDKMQEAGYLGEGVDVAIFDAGFIGADTLKAFRPIYADGRLKDAFNFVNNTNNVYALNFDHGTRVFSVMGANSDQYRGGAYGANFYLYLTEDYTTEYRVEEYNWLFAAERADSIGVDVINSSLSYNTFDDASMNYTIGDMNGKTSVISRAARKAVERGIITVAAAGNDGDDSWRYIGVPADADGVITVGAVDASERLSIFSSVGPTADGRIKPDVAAQGEGGVVMTSDGSIVGDQGTSLASPLVASLVAGLREALPNASGKEIYQRLINGASQAAYPNNGLGYGIPNFIKSKDLTEIPAAFEVYPNPVSGDVLKILFKDPQDQALLITIFGISGQRVAELSDFISGDNNPYTVDVTGLRSGVYAVRIQTPATTGTIRVVRIN